MPRHNLHVSAGIRRRIPAGTGRKLHEDTPWPWRKWQPVSRSPRLMLRREPEQRVGVVVARRRPAEADGSRLLAHGMQEVVGSSPTSSTANGLQSGRFQ